MEQSRHIPGFTAAAVTYLRPAQDWARQHSTLDRGGAHEATPLPEGLLTINGVGKKMSLFKLFV